MWASGGGATTLGVVEAMVVEWLSEVGGDGGASGGGCEWAASVVVVVRNCYIWPALRRETQYFLCSGLHAAKHKY